MRTLLLASLLWFGSGVLAAESPEFVRIYAIDDKEVPNHPSIAEINPGEQISFRVDVLQFGEACPHPEGCPEGRNAEEFKWTADGAESTAFEAQGNTMIFHIPPTMGNEIKIAVSHIAVSSGDSITLHNSHLAPPVVAGDSPREPHYVYLHDSDWCPYYPYTGCYDHPRAVVGISIVPYGYYYYGPPYWYHAHYYRPFWHPYAYWHHPYYAPHPVAFRAPHPYFRAAPPPRFRAPRFHRRRR